MRDEIGDDVILGCSSSDSEAIIRDIGARA